MDKITLKNLIKEEVRNALRENDFASNLKTVVSKTGRVWTAENLQIGGKKHFTLYEAMENAPEGFRLPTKEEWMKEILTWNSQDIEGALKSPLKLPAEGHRGGRSGELDSAGSYGFYWSSSIRGSYAIVLYFLSDDALLNSWSRDFRCSVRYIKD